MEAQKNTPLTLNHPNIDLMGLIAIALVFRILKQPVQQLRMYWDYPFQEVNGQQKDAMDMIPEAIRTKFITVLVGHLKKIRPTLDQENIVPLDLIVNLNVSPTL